MIAPTRVAPLLQLLPLPRVALVGASKVLQPAQMRGWQASLPQRKMLMIYFLTLPVSPLLTKNNTMGTHNDSCWGSLEEQIYHSWTFSPTGSFPCIFSPREVITMPVVTELFQNPNLAP